MFLYTNDPMSIRSRFQAPPVQSPEENPNLKPRAPQIDPWASRGRFQNVNLPSNAEERTRVPDKNVVFQQKQTTTGPNKVEEEETTTTVMEDAS